MSNVRLLSKSSLIAFIILLAVSLFAFYPSFQLALFGDDWLAFVRYLYHLGPNPGVDGKWTHLSYFLTPYGSQDILMGLLYKVYGYNSTLYYLTSYSFRLIASLSLIPLSLYLTKSRLAAFFAVLFFAVASTGIETTNWVFNMPSYIAIAFFNLFLYFFIKAREPKQVKLLIPSAIFYYLAYVTTPIRMHGVLPFVFLIEFFYIFKNRDFKTVKSAFLRVLVIVLVFVFISKTGHSNGPSNDWKERFGLGVTQSQTMLSSGRFDFIFYPLVIFGGAIIPDSLFRAGSFTGGRLDFIMFSIPLMALFAVFLIIIAKNSIASNKIKTANALLISAAWALFTFIIFLTHRDSFNNSILIGLMLIGGYTLITGLLLAISDWKNQLFVNGLFIGFAWTVMSFFAPWWWNLSGFIFSTHRYMVPAAAGVSLLLALFIAAGKNLKSRKVIFALFSLLIIIQVFSTRSFLSKQLEAHSQKVSDKIWNSFPYYPEIGTDSNLRLFYFEGDESVQGIIHDVITFGFPTHLGLIYKYYIHHGTGNNVATNIFGDLISSVTDGIYLTAHGRIPAKPIEPDYIYAFKVVRVADNVSLIDMTTEVREKLKKIAQVP